MSVNVKIIEGDLASADVIALLGEHLKEMADYSPPESIHALDVQGLGAKDITFWSAWDRDDLCGCGALKELDARHGEIKSMRTADAHVGKGVGSAILRHIMNEAEKRHYLRLSLETGSDDAFAPAHSLYERFGFIYCEPFANYREDRFSRYMTLELP